MLQVFVIMNFFLLMTSCENEKTSADVILKNASVYTVNPNNPRAGAVAISNGKIMAVGVWAKISEYRGKNTEIIDLKGQFLMPGFIEGHAHFDGLGETFLDVDLRGTRNWPEVVQRARMWAANRPSSEWIVGRGWHQEKWDQIPESSYEGYPDHSLLSSVTPYHPVLLEHVSGHAVMANARAMQLAGISRETPDPEGGRILRNDRGAPIGIFEENAAELITDVYDDYLNSLPSDKRSQRWDQIISFAQEECLKKGITSFHDAGTSWESLGYYKEAAEAGKFKVRLYTMLREPYDSLKTRLSGFPVIGLANDKLTCRALKVMFDGALGSYGAWLLESYADEAGYFGQNTTSPDQLALFADLALKHGMQLCTHAIGDRANREVLDIYKSKFDNNPGKEDLRWRIEHVQHLHPQDIPRFAESGVIASMQAVHCTSDAPFVEKRLGSERSANGAYAWRALLDAGAVIANGTDAPVEDVNPLECIYASVTRKRIDDGMEFYPEQAMIREEAIRSYTISNAYAAFEEDRKGTIEPGKHADLVVLSNDIVTCAPEQILETEVLMTMIGGEVVFFKSGFPDAVDEK